MKMVEIECLACGEALKIPQYINTDNYNGQVVCQECKSLLYVKLVKGKAEKYKVVVRNFNLPNTLSEMYKKYHEEEKQPQEKEK